MQLRSIRHIQRGYQTEERALVVTVTRDHWDFRDPVAQNEVLRGTCEKDPIRARCEYAQQFIWRNFNIRPTKPSENEALMRKDILRGHQMEVEGGIMEYLLATGQPHA